MHAHLLSILAQTTTPTTTGKTTSSSSPFSYILILGFAVVAYFLIIRPRTQKVRQQQAEAAKASQIGVGDEVVSVGGIHGRIVAIDADVAEVEVAPNTVLTFTRRAVSLKPGTTAGAAAAGEPVDEEWEVPGSKDEPPSRPEDAATNEGETRHDEPGSGS